MGSPELKRRFLTFGEKIEVIRLSKTKISQRKLAFTYGVSLGTINRTLKQKRDILNASESENWNPERRRLKSGNDDLNVAVLKWFVAARSKNIPISGPLIKEKARLIAKDMGLNDFKGSNGWLSSFQTRNNILFKAIRKGSAKVNTYDVNKWNATLPRLCENNAAEDILATEETGVYKALHSHSPVQSNDPCNGIETSKGYSPVLAGSDMTNFAGYTCIQKCPTSGCNGEGHVTGRFTAHHKLSGCPIAPQNKEKLLMYQYMNGDARSSPEDLKPIEPVKIPKKRGRKKKKRDRDENEALSTLHQGIHQSVFMSTYVPPNPAKDLPLNWDQHSKLLPGLSSVTGGSAIRWSVDDVTRFVMSLPGCADVSQHFKEEQIDGEAFLLLNQTDMVKILNMKLGPAIKIYNSILMLKRTLET